MADGLTSSVQAPFVAGVYGSSQTLSPTILDLGSDTLTYNPVRQAVSGLFSPASSGSFFSSVNGFVAVATAGSLPSAPGTNATQTAIAAAYNAALQLIHRETAADAYLRYLLNQTTAFLPTSTPAPAPVTPKITANTGTSAAQGGMAFINSTALSASAGGAPNIDITYNITNGPSNGYLALAYAPNAPIASFTQYDLTAGLVEYVNNGEPQAGDSFTFDVSGASGPATQGTFNIALTPPSGVQPLQISANAGANVTEGGSTVITAAQLRATDTAFGDGKLDYYVTSQLSNGHLELSTNPGAAITQFTQANVDAGQLVYVHNGSETASDSFTFAVAAGSTRLSGNTFNISVSPAPPDITVNAGASVDEGSSVTLTTANLSASDEGVPDSSLTYNVTSAPANGTLQLSSNPGVAITSFTQADLAAGLVQYVNSNGEPGSDAFTFTVSDGTATSSANTFNIAVNSAAPDITANTGASVTEGSSVTLTTTNLSASDAGEPDSGIVFTVTSAPQNGYLQLASNPGTAITSFTQADLAAGNVQYVHDGSETSSDSFTFAVADSGDTSSNTGTFNIAVNPVAPVVSTNTGATVNESSSVTLTTANLGATDQGAADSDLLFNVTSSPNYGILQLSTNPGSAITSFTQADLAAGRVQYVNYGAEVTSDSFTFNVSDGGTASSNATFNITINPVPPQLDTNSAATVNEGSAVTLTTSNLSASDAGQADTGIVYNVTSAPSGGYLQLSTNPGASITSFTQADLTAGKVQYVNSGMSESATDAFSFTLSDGSTPSTPYTFNINVNPVPPTITTNTGTTVSRLAGSTILTTAQLNATDPGDAASQINFNVTGGLTKGYLDLSTNPGVQITSFTEAQLQAGIVQYVHTAFGLAPDSFTFNVSDGTPSASATFNINVTV